jgi:hypothetical protein
MPNLINLTCPKCGGKLQITNDIDRFSCGYCGNELILQRSGGGITVTPIVEGLREVKAGVDKTASELAIVRLEKEIYYLSLQRDNIAAPLASWGKLEQLELALILSVLGAFMVLLFNWALRAKILCWVILVFVFVYAYLTFTALKKEIPRQLAPIDQMIAEKKQELEKHRNIVRIG